MSGKIKRTVDKISHLLRGREDIWAGGSNVIEQMLNWLQMQDDTMTELAQKVDKLMKPFKCPECPVEFFNQQDVDLHRVENHWQDHTVNFDKVAGFDGAEQTEVIVVFDSKHGVVSFSSTGVDPRKGAPASAGVVPSMDEWAAARSVPIVPGLRCGCGASLAHELEGDAAMHSLWVLSLIVSPPVEKVKGDDQITIELAARRVQKYMKNHFSSATIQGVLGALKGH